MTTVAFGGRLVLTAGGRSVGLRVLRETVLADTWEIPVLADVAALEHPSGEVELRFADGVRRVPAHLTVLGGLLVLRAGRPEDGEAPLLRQRRDDVRGRLPLPVRGAVLGQHAPGPGTGAFSGVTVTVSAGGVAVAVPQPDLPRLPAGAATFLELELPDGSVVPSVIHVVEHGEECLRGRFVDIAAADRERLVRLIFAEERKNLAARSRTSRDG